MMFDDRVQGVIDKVNQLRDLVDDHWQVPVDEGLLLAQLVRLGGCKCICEIGTSYGFSSLHLAAAVGGNGGVLHCFEISERKVAAARGHIEEAGLGDVVEFHLGDARAELKHFDPGSGYDFVFVDAVKEQSGEYLDALQGKLASRVTIATDNVLTHGEQTRDFVERLRGLDGASSCLVAVGNGLELTLLGC